MDFVSGGDLMTLLIKKDILSEEEITRINTQSKLVKKYAESIDRESAFELLANRISANAATTEATVNSSKKEQSSAETKGNDINKTVIKAVTSASFIRGAFGILMKLLKK